MKKDKKKGSCGCRIFIPFGEWTDFPFRFRVPVGAQVKFLINQCTDDPSGVIAFIDMDLEKIK